MFFEDFVVIYVHEIIMHASLMDNVHHKLNLI